MYQTEISRLEDGFQRYLLAKCDRSKGCFQGIIVSEWRRLVFMPTSFGWQHVWSIFKSPLPDVQCPESQWVFFWLQPFASYVSVKKLRLWWLIHHLWSFIHHFWWLIHHLWWLIQHWWWFIHHLWSFIHHLWWFIHISDGSLTIYDGLVTIYDRSFSIYDGLFTHDNPIERTKIAAVSGSLGPPKHGDGEHSPRVLTHSHLQNII